MAGMNGNGTNGTNGTANGNGGVAVINRPPQITTSRSFRSGIAHLEEGLAKLDDHYERQRRDTAFRALHIAGVSISSMQDVMAQLGFRYPNICTFKSALRAALGKE